MYYFHSFFILWMKISDKISVSTYVFWCNHCKGIIKYTQIPDLASFSCNNDRLFIWISYVLSKNINIFLTEIFFQPMLGLGEVKKLQVMKGPQSKLILDIYQTSYYNSKSDKMWSTSFCDLMNHVTDHTGNRNVSVGEENYIELMEQY